MKQTVSVLLIIMGIIGSISTLMSDSSMIYRIINISFIIIICILQIIKDITKVNKEVMTIVELLSIIGAMMYGFAGFEYLLPIIIFEIVGSKINLVMCTCISIGISIFFVSENIFNIAVYTIVICLYLYEIKKQYLNNIELKEFNRGQRYARHIMEKKITNLERYLEQNNVVASLRERNFIAQKLHDHLGHRITSSLMQLEVTKETLGKDNELSEKYLVSSMNNLREGMDEIRDVLRNIKPRDKVMGIEDIKEELLKFQYSCGIKATLKVEGDTDRIRLNIWMVIADNIKEALTNTAKYSEATEVKVFILIYNKIARIEVRDNGKGCNNIKKGLGFKGMEERMQGIGGRVEYSNNYGFVINMLLNLGD